jgi:hypothetical protein
MAGSGCFFFVPCTVYALVVNAGSNSYSSTPEIDRLLLHPAFDVKHVLHDRIIRIFETEKKISLVEPIKKAAIRESGYLTAPENAIDYLLRWGLLSETTKVASF